MEANRIPPTLSVPNHGAARAFARVGWPKLWLVLLRYATGTLRLAAIDAERAGVFEAADLVLALSEKSLDGTLPWALGDEATEAQIVGLACAKLAGMRWTLQRQAARTVCDDALEERPDPGPDALMRLMDARGIADIEGAFAHDADASAYLREMLDGATRADIMETLGWPLRRAHTVHARIMRGVAALGRKAIDDGEGEPEGSGP